MSNDKRMEALYKHAANHRFEAFDRLFTELEATISFEQFWEAYLMRAQIKLFAGDPFIIDDLVLVGSPDAQPQFPCLNTVWEADAPNRFIIYSKAPGLLQSFAQSLPRVHEIMTHLYGAQGGIMVRLMQFHLLYLRGEIQESFELTEDSFKSEDATPTDILMLLCARFRCYLALGATEDAEHCMMEVIRMSKKYPSCIAPYLSFRGWANITTSWNGESPRFSEDAAGQQQPVFDDRLEDIRKGSARTTPLEAPFEDYAARHYDGAVTLREYYMEVFHAMYWLLVGNTRQAETCAQGLYEMATTTGMIMPLVECGEQIMPLLRHVKKKDIGISDAWLEKISAMAQQYEKMLEMYREIDV